MPVQALLEQLIAIPSINPALVEGGGGEADVADFIAQWLDRAGLEVSVEEVTSGRPNVIATLVGSGGGRSLMLNSHTDTVGVHGMDRPFEASVADGRLYGRGACDTKGGLAAAMEAVAELAQGPRLRGDVVLTAVVDEEHGSVGTTAVVERHRADGVIVIEPSALRLCTEHMGFAWFSIETTGVAAHGSLPQQGRDAVVAMGSVLVEVGRLQRRLEQASAHPTLPPGSVHASLIEGGVEMSSYPVTCRLRIERRTLPTDTPEVLADQIDDILDRASAEWLDGIEASWQMDTYRNGLDTARDSGVVHALAHGIERVTGESPEFMSATGWTDAAVLADAGIPSVICGPRGGDHHTPNEWVDLASVTDFSRALVHTARGFCQ